MTRSWVTRPVSLDTVPASEGRYGRLTDMQWAVVEQILEDAPDVATLARRLNVTENTIKTHMRSVYTVFGCHSRARLVLGLLRGEYVPLTSRQSKMPVDAA